MLKRERYLSKIRPFYHLDLVKILIGLRRSGKSELLKQIKNEILNEDQLNKTFIEIDFENYEYNLIKTPKLFLEFIDSRINKEHKTYIFIDEIQELEDFERVIASLKNKYNVSIFITGSNAKLLSGENATYIAGRYVSFTIMPFSYSEYIDYMKLLNKEINDDSFFDYATWGGLPQRLILDEPYSIQAYLQDVMDSVIMKDIAFNMDKFSKSLIIRIVRFLFNQSGRNVSINNVYKTLFNDDTTVRKDDVYDYVYRCIDSKAITPCLKYDLNGHKILQAIDKYYVSDLGLKTLVNPNKNIDVGQAIETIVFNELQSRGYQCFVGKTYKGEVDFVVFNGTKKCFIQVAYLLATDEVVEREFGAFKPIKDQSPKFVLSMDKFDFTRDGISHINIIDFLLFKKDIFFT